MLAMGIFLGGLGWLYTEPEEASGPESPWWVTSYLRPASHLDSKISVGKSPRLGTHQGWFMDYHGMLGEVEKKPFTLYWHVSRLFLKYLTERFST